MSKDSNNWRDHLWCRYIRLFDSRLPFRTGLASVPDGWRENIAILLEGLEQIVRADRLGRLTIIRLHHHDGMLAIDCDRLLVRDLRQRCKAIHLRVGHRCSVRHASQARICRYHTELAAHQG